MSDRPTPQWSDIADLVRLPAVATVPGDAWAGAAAAGWSRGRLMPLASALFYLGGMALNDWADRDLDAVERPERPIPSGRVAAEDARTLASGLLAGGVVVATAVGGGRALRLALPLVGAIVAYDVVAKDTALGPPTMAVCRALDVALGATPDLSQAAAPMAATAAHTWGVTTLSRHEVHGGAGDAARLALAATAVAAVASQAPAWRRDDDAPQSAVRRWGRRLAGLAAAGRYTVAVAPGYRSAIADPDDPAVVQSAVGRGVMGNTALQTATLSGLGAWPAAIATAAVADLARRRRAAAHTDVT